MKKVDTYMINKIFTVPYFDKMISNNSDLESFSKCVKRFIKREDATIGEVIISICADSRNSDPKNQGIKLNEIPINPNIIGKAIKNV